MTGRDDRSDTIGATERATLPPPRATLSLARATLLLGALALAAPAGPVAAQAEIDARWLPWLGCWESAGGTPVSAEKGGDELVCTRPAADGVSLELVTVVDAEVTEVERIRGDGEAVRVSGEGCEEARSVRFSEDGDRVFTRTRYLCEGDLERSASGIMAFLSPDEWIEVSVVEAEGESLPWVRRYRAASPQAAAEAGFESIPSGRAEAVRMARRASAAGLSVDEVIEASEHAHPAAVRTWIAERGQRLRVNSDVLVRMDDAGVPAEVIDVVVAVSFPERFALDRDEPRGAYGRRGARRGGFGPYAHGYDRGLPPWYYDYWFTPFGRRHGFGTFGGFGPTRVIIVDRRDIDSGGRVVNDRGYTRRPSGSRSSGSVGPGSRSGPSGSSGSAAPSSSSSDRSDTGRRAKPRGGGNGS